MEELKKEFLKDIGFKKNSEDGLELMMPWGEEMKGTLDNRKNTLLQRLQIMDIPEPVRASKNYRVVILIDYSTNKFTTLVLDPVFFRDQLKRIAKFKKPLERIIIKDVDDKEVVNLDSKDVFTIITEKWDSEEKNSEDSEQYSSYDTQGYKVFEEDTYGSNNNDVSSMFQHKLPNGVESAQELKKHADLLEYQQTHDLVCKHNLNNHKPSEHKFFKSLLRRMPKESPYLYYGLEIEVETPNEIDNNVFATEVIKRTGGIVTASRDGSLSHGVEFYTRPTSYKVLTSKDFIEKLDIMFDVFKRYGVFSVSQRTSSMHIHISNKFFEKKYKQASEAQSEMAWIAEFYSEELQNIAGRKCNNYCNTMEQAMKEGLPRNEINYDIVLKKSPMSRNHYRAVTAGQEGKTVEFRMFRSPRDTTELLAMVEVVRALAHAVRENNTDKKNLSEILHCKNNKFLDKYLAKNRMNIRETKVLKESKHVSSGL